MNVSMMADLVDIIFKIAVIFIIIFQIRWNLTQQKWNVSQQEINKDVGERFIKLEEKR